MSEFIAPPCHGVIEVLYQDEHILLINKPSGLLSLSGKNPLNKDSVHYRLVQDFPSATLLHRLDFGTSGIMLVALNKQVNGLLTQQFQQRTISKTYTAILHGVLPDDEGEVDLPIAKDVDNFPFMKICHETGKPAQSHYRVISRDLQELSTKVTFRPITGRTHQLRIHSLHLGHPILGCDLYFNAQSRHMSSRLLLHATTLTFIHPISLETINCVCPSPF
ncbi:RluA family pseudouridine synthase [Shewanella ulleungensis]|jgi:tRNA pseudouridine32 synthase/23S rRNA pseudouridine746 synthase|uniref:RluA family pseudouridine synthase n=1 Tax=Shewanella ulleungensis TaxID=2282699 RepID=UPI00166E01B5|nr:pseudouridine synthase [Shewanella ulleungensis]MCL1150013.1 pseudouridine synthase [Shewanella ulleungensis]